MTLHELQFASEFLEILVKKAHFSKKPAAPRSLKAPSIQQLGPDVSTLKHAFLVAPFRESARGMLDRFSSMLNAAAEEFASQEVEDDSALLAPIIAVVQSSGVGKTRLVYEHAKRHFTFFCCSRMKGKLTINMSSSSKNEFIS